MRLPLPRRGGDATGHRRVLVVSCHPLPDSLIGAARERTLAGLERTSAEVRHRDLYVEGFVPELSADEQRHHIEPGVSDDVRDHADDLRWCDTLVLVYPTWWSGQPAMLKGWFDRVWASGVAFDLPPGASTIRPRLQNIRHLVAVTSHGSSRFLNGIQGPTGRRTFFRWLRVLCHPLARCHWIAFYGVDTRPDTDRAEFLDRVEERIADLCG